MRTSRVIVSGWLALLSCQENVGPSVGSETHFLRWCSDADSCSEGLTCTCGVCSTSCTSADVCKDISPLAECTPSGSTATAESCDPLATSMVCEVPCLADGDCSSLSESHRCDRGFCRELASNCTTGAVPANEVLLLGDRFLADNQQITAELEALARSTNSISTDEHYRDYSSSLVSPFGGNQDVPSQYALSENDGQVRVVIMGIGGPDALLACAEPLTEDCPTLQNALAGAESLLAQMDDDGVQQVVLYFYPDPQDLTLKAKFDLLRPLLQSACAATPLACHFVDLRPVFSGNESELLDAEGILPTSAGSRAAAAAIWGTMGQRCVAQ